MKYPYPGDVVMYQPAYSGATSKCFVNVLLLIKKGFYWLVNFTSLFVVFQYMVKAIDGRN